MNPKTEKHTFIIITIILVAVILAFALLRSRHNADSEHDNGHGKLPPVSRTL